jgi:hypothetical protein
MARPQKSESGSRLIRILIQPLTDGRVSLP